jgi:hypothetical protein
LPRWNSDVARAGMYRSGSTAVSSRYSATASLVDGSIARAVQLRERDAEVGQRSVKIRAGGTTS